MVDILKKIINFSSNEELSMLYEYDVIEFAKDYNIELTDDDVDIIENMKLNNKNLLEYNDIIDEGNILKIKYGISKNILDLNIVKYCHYKIMCYITTNSLICYDNVDKKTEKEFMIIKKFIPNAKFYSIKYIGDEFVNQDYNYYYYYEKFSIIEDYVEDCDLYLIK